MLARLRRELSLERAADWLGFGCVLLCIAIALRPVFHDLDLYGGHDWDEMSAHRLLTVKALLRFGQLPLWMPYVLMLPGLALCVVIGAVQTTSLLRAEVHA